MLGSVQNQPSASLLEQANAIQARSRDASLRSSHLLSMPRERSAFEVKKFYESRYVDWVELSHSPGPPTPNLAGSIHIMRPQNWSQVKQNPYLQYAR
jgi:hypothetical protein